MDFLVLDENFNTIYSIENYNSMIWVDRYSDVGDFELHTGVDLQLLTVASIGYYIWAKHSEKVMVIEGIEINTDVENGNTLTITGRSLESFLMRRIIWDQTILTGNLEDSVRKLITDNIINPINPDRKINNFYFLDSDDPGIRTMAVEAQFTGTVLFDAIKYLCDSNDVGFKIFVSKDQKLFFTLYNGQDRSENQTENNIVEFSPRLDNLLTSNYIESCVNERNVVLVAGEGEGSDRRTTTIGDSKGLSRRELFVDARDLSSDTIDGILSEADYNKQLEQRGKDKLTEYTNIKSFDSNVSEEGIFVYYVDYFLGDIVQIINEYDISGRSRVVEVIYNNDSENGISILPTFINIEEEGE